MNNVKFIQHRVWYRPAIGVIHHNRYHKSIIQHETLLKWNLCIPSFLVFGEGCVTKTDSPVYISFTAEHRSESDALPPGFIASQEVSFIISFVALSYEHMRELGFITVDEEIP